MTPGRKKYSNHEYHKNVYKDVFISKCFYQFTDNKEWKDQVPCVSIRSFREKDLKSLDSLTRLVKIKLNNKILELTEGRASLYYYGPNKTNLLEDSLKAKSVSSFTPAYDCISTICMDIYRSKDMDKLAEEYAQWRIKDLKKKWEEDDKRIKQGKPPYMSLY